MRANHSRFALKYLFVSCLGLSAVPALQAESLEDRVSALENTQKQHSDALQSVSDLAKKVEVSGFLSVRGGQIDSDTMSYLNVLENEWTFSEESVAGLQLDITPTENLTVSLQLKASGLSDGVELEWAYLEYAFAPDFKVRGGRLRTPGFMLSEYRDIGYAYPWVQVPFEVYGWLPFNRYEGLDMRYWMSMGDVDLRLSAYGGTSADQKLRIGNFEYADQKTRFAGVEVQATYDIYTVRAGYSSYRFKMYNGVLDDFLGPLVNGVTLAPDIAPYVDEVKFPGLMDYVQDVMVGDWVTVNSGVLTDVALGIQNDGNPANDFLIPILQAEGASLISQLEPFQNIPQMDGENSGDFVGVGFSSDNGELLVMSELTFSMMEGITPDVESGYIMVGYRFGNWMPHFTFAKMYTVSDDVWPDVQPLVSNPFVNQIVPGYAQLLEGANMYAGGAVIVREAMRVEQESYTLGVRWDPMPGVALKTEVFQADMKGTSFGFALPKNILEFLGSDITELAGTNLEFPEPESSVLGVRVALDMVF